MRRSLLLGLIFGAVLLAVIAFVLDAGGHFTVYSELKRLSGLIGLGLLSAQLLLASRFPLFEKTFKRAELVKMHRVTGVIALLVLLGHGLIEIVGSILIYGSASRELMLAGPGRLLGLVALLLITLAAITALFWKGMKLSYKAWSRIHLVNFFAIPLVLAHSFLLGTTIRYQPLALVFWGLAAAIYLLALVFRLVRGRQKSLAARDKAREGEGL